MPTHRDTILPLRAPQAAKRAFLAVPDDLTIARIASDRAQLPDRKVALAGESNRPANPPQHKVGDAE